MSTTAHPVFAWAWPRIAAAGERRGTSAHRDELLAGLRGRVLEIGPGAGTNFTHYPSGVSEVVAVEPEPTLREHARRAAVHAPLAVQVIGGEADALPVASGAFDAVVASMVLCSVEDPPAAVAEIARVLTDGGELRVYEHVRSQRPGLARIQDALDLMWPRMAGGCHTGRATMEILAQAGFEPTSMRSFDFRPCMLAAPVAPHVIAVCRLEAR